MKIKLLSMARRLWNVPYVPGEVNRRNQLKWARSAYWLGDKWLLAKFVQKRTTPLQ